MDAMQVTETLAEGLKHEFQISVPASDLDAKADAKLKGEGIEADEEPELKASNVVDLMAGR